MDLSPGVLRELLATSHEDNRLALRYPDLLIKAGHLAADHLLGHRIASGENRCSRLLVAEQLRLGEHHELLNARERNVVIGEAAGMPVAEHIVRAKKTR